MATSNTRLAPITKESSLVDRITDRLRRSIIDGDLAPGDTLAISSIAEDLEVSLGPVREALERLSGQGLVELRPARTAIVTPLALSDLHDIYVMCRLMEVDAAVRALPDLTDSDLTEADQLLELLLAAPRGSTEFWRAHDAFHLALMRPVLSTHLERFLTQLWQARERYSRFDVRNGPGPVVWAAESRHRAILQVAHEGDVEEMRSVLTKHLEVNERRLANSLAQSLSAVH
jgi:DNA-binding GntR family transcriptional regulator